MMTGNKHQSASSPFPLPGQKATARVRACIALSAVLEIGACAQGTMTFQNLGFESAIVPILPPGQSMAIFFTNALPGWNGYVGTNVQNLVLYNQVSAGGALISLIDLHTTDWSNNVIAGN